MSKTTLSYSRIRDLIEVPHSHINRLNGLSRYSPPYFQEGSEAHKIIQKHVSGVETHPVLAQVELPTFSVVEEVDRDPRTEIKFSINDDYDFIGYRDGFEPKKRMLEVKTSGSPWSVGMFSRLKQWKLYALGCEEKEVYLINTPRNPDEWRPDNIKVFHTQVTDKDREEAWKFIRMGIETIEHIYDKDLFVPSRQCRYISCPFGCDYGENKALYS